MTHVPPLSPGCFGSALTFKEEDSVCRGCKFAELCKPAHLDAKAQLQARFGITKMSAKSKAAKAEQKKEAARSEDPAVLALPVKVQEIINKLDRGNYQVVEKLRSGENPFGSTMPFMKIACHLLLRIERPLDRPLLAQAFMHKMNWGQGTADAHARMAIQALTHVGAVDNVDGRISLRRAK